MALNIKSSEVEQLAREIAALTGESITETIRKALIAQRDEARALREAEIARRMQAMEAVQRRVETKGGIPELGKVDFDALYEDGDQR